MTNIDKLWHFLGTTVLLSIIYVSINLLEYFGCQKRPRKLKLLFAGASAFAVGILKEVLDRLSDDWFWCSPTCSFDIFDILTNIAGIIFGILLILVYSKLKSSLSEEATHNSCEHTDA